MQRTVKHRNLDLSGPSVFVVDNDRLAPNGILGIPDNLGLTQHVGIVNVPCVTGYCSVRVGSASEAKLLQLPSVEA